MSCENCENCPCKGVPAGDVVFPARLEPWQLHFQSHPAPVKPKHLAKYDGNGWIPSCPYGDCCSGCDAAGKCCHV